ncbi:MAG TPA: CBS domain-containing protein [Blastocatellia bacterium]|nr:CBS domain-containing protein [Blastocatellia bacterium]
MRVSEVMTTNPTCCIPTDTAQTAAIIMRDEDTGIVPVIEHKGGGKLVGVVTDRDLCLGVLAGRPQGADVLNPASIPIKHCMTTSVVYCNPNDTLETVLELMQDNQIRRIFVVDDQNMILGVVSLSDLMNRGRVPKGETRETLKAISEPTGEASKPRAQSASAKAE